MTTTKPTISSSDARLSVIRASDEGAAKGPEYAEERIRAVALVVADAVSAVGLSSHADAMRAAPTDAASYAAADAALLDLDEAGHDVEMVRRAAWAVGAAAAALAKATRAGQEPEMRAFFAQSAAGSAESARLICCEGWSGSDA